MVNSCSAFNCTSRFKKGGGVRFYRLPKEKNRRDLWLKAMNPIRNNWTPGKGTSVCEHHFQSGKPSLDVNHPDYVPNIFSFKSRTAGLSYERRKNVIGKHQYVLLPVINMDQKNVSTPATNFNFNEKSPKKIVSSCYAVDLRSFLKDKFGHKEKKIPTEIQSLPSSTYVTEQDEDTPSAEFSNQEREIENKSESLPSTTHIIRLKEEMLSAENSGREKVVNEDIFSEEHLSSDTNIKPTISEIPAISPARKRKKTVVSSVTREEDSYDIYGKFIANEVRSIADKEQQRLLKLKIQAMIYYAHKGRLKGSGDN